MHIKLSNQLKKDISMNTVEPIFDDFKNSFKTLNFNTQNDMLEYINFFEKANVITSELKEKYITGKEGATISNLYGHHIDFIISNRERYFYTPLGSDYVFKLDLTRSLRLLYHYHVDHCINRVN